MTFFGMKWSVHVNHCRAGPVPTRSHVPIPIRPSCSDDIGRISTVHHGHDRDICGIPTPIWPSPIYRGRPFFDLLSRVSAQSTGRSSTSVAGPGNATVTLAERWRGHAHWKAWDNSPEMVALRERSVDADVGGIAEWVPRPDTDVVVSNAALQWVPEHRELLTQWISQLDAGAWIAFRVPGNFDSPSHRVRCAGGPPDTVRHAAARCCNTGGTCGGRPGRVRGAAHRRGLHRGCLETLMCTN